MHACLQVRLASVRRSLFVSDAERSKFLNALVAGTRDILRARQGLAEHANYHEFCRLLGRLKTNYQLSELVRPPVAPAPALPPCLGRAACIVPKKDRCARPLLHSELLLWPTTMAMSKAH